MKRSFTMVLLMLVACAGAREVTTQAKHGALEVDILPNPIVARPISGDTYEFPFEVALRETGGVDIEIEGLRVRVVMLKGIGVFSQTYAASEIERRGFPTLVPAGGRQQYRFAPRREVTNAMIFQGVSAEITVEARDALGNEVEGKVTVTVKR